MIPPASQVDIRDWAGLVTKADGRDVPEGAAQDQVNAQSERPGELRPRRGLRVVQFEAE